MVYLLASTLESMGITAYHFTGIELLDDRIRIWGESESIHHVRNEQRAGWTGSLSAIQGSATGRPATNTTIVGFPVSLIALTRFSCAPTRPRSATSTCSPVVAFSPSQTGRVRDIRQLLHLRRKYHSLTECLVPTPSTNHHNSCIR